MSILDDANSTSKSPGIIERSEKKTRMVGSQIIIVVTQQKEIGE